MTQKWGMWFIRHNMWFWRGQALITTKALLLYRPGEACGSLESIFQPIVQACGSFRLVVTFGSWEYVFFRKYWETKTPSGLPIKALRFQSKTLSRSTDANLDCVFVKIALFISMIRECKKLTDSNWVSDQPWLPSVWSGCSWAQRHWGWDRSCRLPAAILHPGLQPKVWHDKRG